MAGIENSQLGKATDYSSSYDPGLLYPLARSEGRERIGMPASLPFHGEDCWTSYELSWLSPTGKPNAAIARIRVPADSQYMVESKSLKLYLNGLNQKVFDSIVALENLIAKDLGSALFTTVKVSIESLGIASEPEFQLPENAVLIDDLVANDFVYQPDASLLTLDETEPGVVVEERLLSHLLRSNCPVTGQPDWGTVWIRYRGVPISHTGLLRYIVSFRQCQDFHEQCVERMFLDIMARCRCESLSVYAGYTRRGGIEINPYRATPDFPQHAPLFRFNRQ